MGVSFKTKSIVLAALAGSIIAFGGYNAINNSQHWQATQSQAINMNSNSPVLQSWVTLAPVPRNSSMSPTN